MGPSGLPHLQRDRQTRRELARPMASRGEARDTSAAVELRHGCRHAIAVAQSLRFGPGEPSKSTMVLRRNAYPRELGTQGSCRGPVASRIKLRTGDGVR